MHHLSEIWNAESMQDGQQIQIVPLTISSQLLETRVNILLIIKVKIHFSIDWSYIKSPSIMFTTLLNLI